MIKSHFHLCSKVTMIVSGRTGSRLLFVLCVSGLWSTPEGQGIIPFIPFENLTRTAKFFEDKDVLMYKAFLYDSERKQLFLGAKDVLLRLNLDLEDSERLSLPAPKDVRKECRASHAEEDCHNFIPVLNVYSGNPDGTLVYACGTHAFEPKCYVRNATQLSNTNNAEELPGENRSPKNPTYRGFCPSWLNVEKNLLFIGGYLDQNVQESTVAVSEFSENPTFKLKKLKGKPYLEDAEFVGGFEQDPFMYFVFSEDSIETPQQGGLSRIARVCADGDQEANEIVSFTKARLECGNYGKIKAIYFLRAQLKLFATFTNKESASAICMYDFSDILLAFKGEFLCRKGPESQWEKCPPRPPGPGRIKTCYGDRSIEDTKDRVLLEATVHPTCGTPSFETHGSASFSKLAVKVSTLGYYDYKVYVGDDLTGYMWNVNVGPCNQSESYEIWEVTREKDREFSFDIVSVNILGDSVYVVTCCGILKYSGLDFLPTMSWTTSTTPTSTVTSNKPLTTKERQASTSAAPPSDTTLTPLSSIGGTLIRAATSAKVAFTVISSFTVSRICKFLT